VNDRGDLGDQFAAMQRHQHMMAGLRQIGGETIRVDRLVKHALGDALEQRRVAEPHLPDFKLRRCHCGPVHPSASDRSHTRQSGACLIKTSVQN
jgi:hypothetical protein